MVFTLYNDGSLLKTSLLDVYNCLCYPIGRTLRPSVDCPGGGTFHPSGGQFALVQNVRGDILHGGTFRPPTKWKRIERNDVGTCVRNMKGKARCQFVPLRRCVG